MTIQQLPKIVISRPQHQSFIRLRAQCIMCREDIPEHETFHLFEGNTECNRCHAALNGLLEKEKNKRC